MKLLFAEDDRDLSAAVKTLLERSGYLVDAVYDGAEAVDYAAAENYDGMILDWMMPEMDGVEALREMRRRGINSPCLLLTARDALEDRVTGLDAGADDYLPKPFNTTELLARLRAIMRRHVQYAPEIVRFAGLELDRGSMDIRCGSNTVRLGNKAYRLMEMLMENPHRVFTIDQVINRVWGWDNETELNVLWVTVSQLRKKLAELGARAEIRAVRGVGYSLEEGRNEDDAEAEA